MSSTPPFDPPELSGDPEGVATCDLCNTPIYQTTPYGEPVLNPVIRQAYGSAASVRISLSVGERESDCGTGETTHFDICPTCFEEKLKPWLEGQGAEASVESWQLK